ncbi:MAG TPA: hypothetical protein VFP06_08385, partial [Acidimicrobiales bacterium]|nr:hypothetical protein [Acidimicrobiales bacterium]
MATQAVPDGGGADQLGIVAPGTGGTAAVIDAIVDRLRAREPRFLRATGRRLEVGEAFGALRDLAPEIDDGAGERAWREALIERLRGDGGALVVDEAQWLDPASLRVVVGVAERAAEHGFGVVVAHRPVPGDAQLAALDAVLGRRHLLVALGPLDEPEVGELAAIL